MFKSKRNNILKNLVLALLCLVYSQTHGQISVIERQAKQELEKRNLDEDELRNRLLEKGIDLDRLDKLDPNEALQVQDLIEETIKEMEADKNKNKKLKTPPSAIPLNKSNTAQIKQDTGLISEIEKKQVELDSLVRLKNKSQIMLDSVETWGQQLFRNKSITLFSNNADVRPPDSYVLGVGDQISISIWGLSQVNEVHEINQDGYIAPDRMPRIFLRGTSLQKAQQILKSQYGRYYRFNGNEFSIALNNPKEINVNIFGEVYQYGGFALSAANTVFNALMAAKGPTNIGSLRKIKLIRKGKESIVDVYKFMNNPGLEKDFYLENNDIIQVPVAEKVVSISGAVNRPMKYELIQGEELKKLIEYAGGFNPDAITSTIQVERIDQDRKIVLDVPFADLLKKNSDFNLRKGDLITVFKIKTANEDYVFVKGEVRAESSFQYKDKMRLSELIQKIQFTPESNLQNSFIKRFHTDNTVSLLKVDLEKAAKGNNEFDIMLQPKDELSVYKLSTFKDKTYVAVEGAIRLPGKYQIDPKQDLRVKDLVLYSGGLKPEAWKYAFLFRALPDNPKELQVIRVQIEDALNNPNTNQNILVEANDSLLILSETEFSESSFIDVKGAVKNPGRYAYGKGISIFDAISLAGGFKFSAASNRLDIFRVLIKENEPTQTVVKTIRMNKQLNELDENTNLILEPYDIIVIRSQPEFEFQQLVQVEGEVRYPGPYAILKPNEKISELIQRAGGLTEEAFAEGSTLYRSLDSIGFVVLDLNEAMKHPNSRYNFFLKDQDVISVPKKKDLVRISGATNAQELYPDKLLASNNTITVAYYEGKNALFYIEKYAAGISKIGDKRKITVEQANGKINKTKNFLFFKKYPKVYKGSVINVGYKEEAKQRKKKERRDVDWAKFTTDTISQLTAVVSLILLIDTLSK